MTKRASSHKLRESQAKLQPNNIFSVRNKISWINGDKNPWIYSDLPQKSSWKSMSSNPQISQISMDKSMRISIRDVEKSLKHTAYWTEKYSIFLFLGPKEKWRNLKFRSILQRKESQKDILHSLEVILYPTKASPLHVRQMLKIPSIPYPKKLPEVMALDNNEKQPNENKKLSPSQDWNWNHQSSGRVRKDHPDLGRDTREKTDRSEEGRVGAQVASW